MENGQSEFATVTLRLLDYDKEIKNWQSYSLTSSFLSPCDKFTFRISGEDTILYQQLLVPGATVQVAINDLIQCTGYIDDRDIESESGSGTLITITGRDILSRMVNGNINPDFKFITKMTVSDVISSVMIPFGFTKLYNSQGTNLNVITGRPNNESISSRKVTHTDNYANPDYHLDGTITYTPEVITTTEVVANRKKGLTDLPIKKTKANVGEGAYAYIERLIKREGLILKVAADGSGLMVVSPDYDNDFGYNLILKKTQPNNNNVLHASSHVNWMEQPSIIVATGYGSGHEFAKGQLKVVMVNELTALDDNGNYTPEVAKIVARYKGAKLLKIRDELKPLRKFLGTKNAFCPMYLKDDESKDYDQLANFVTRKMSEHQMKALTLKYTVTGHVDSNGYPWAVNTLVNVDDDINDIHEQMWVLERTFTKSVSDGTKTSLTLIRPHTLLFSGVD